MLLKLLWQKTIHCCEVREEGITQGRISIINVMLKKGMSLEEIREITKATKKEIEEARL